MAATSRTAQDTSTRRATPGTRLVAAAGLAFALVASATLALHAGSPQAPAPAAQAAAPKAPQPIGDLNQVMRSIFFPNANIIFNVQLEDPGAKVTTKPGDPGSKFNITSWGDGLYAKWDVVSYAAVALDESAYLLLKPDRMCANGKPAPVTDANWIKFSNEVGDTAKAVYAASTARKRDTVVDLTDRLNESCASCHNVYRRGADATRCMPKP